MSHYKLGPCIVLVAAVRGTREAYDAAMDMLPQAANIDGRPAPEGGSGKFAIREWRSPAQLRGEQLLAWAKARRKSGGLPGVMLGNNRGRPMAEIVPPGYGRMKTAILQQLSGGPKSAREVAEELGNSIRGVWGNLKAMEAEGRVANDVPLEDEDDDGFVRGPKPMLWRLVEKEAA